jgi:hypothetical protein
VSQADRLGSLDARFVRAFKRSGIADAGTFRRKLSPTEIPCTVLVDDAVQFVGDQTQVLNDKKAVTAYYAEIGRPPPIFGDTFTVGDAVYAVDSISNQDASRVVCIVSVK